MLYASRVCLHFREMVSLPALGIERMWPVFGDLKFIPIRPRGLALSGLVEVWCSIVQNVLSVLSRHALRPVLSTI